METANFSLNVQSLPRQLYSASTVPHRVGNVTLRARHSSDAIFTGVSNGKAPTNIELGLDCQRLHHPEVEDTKSLPISLDSMSSFSEDSMVSEADNSSLSVTSDIPATNGDKPQAAFPTYATPAGIPAEETSQTPEPVEKPLASESLVDQSWNWSVPIPGNLCGKKLFPNAKVELPGICSEAEYNTKFKFVASHLEQAINNHLGLRDDIKLRNSMSYSLGMVGQSQETAKPSIVIYCLKVYSKNLRALLENVVLALYCPKDAQPIRLFSHRKTSKSQAVPFELVYFCTDLSPVNRKASATPLMAYFDTTLTWRGGVIQCGSQTASLGLAIETNNFVGVLTVDHLFPAALLSRSGDPVFERCESSMSDIARQLHASRLQDEILKDLDNLWSDSDDEYCLNEAEPAEVSSSQKFPMDGKEQPATESPPNPSEVVVSSQQEWERISPFGSLEGSEPYLDWAIARPKQPGSLPPRQNMFFPEGPDHESVTLNHLAEKPRCHLAEVYMVSGIRRVLRGRLLGSPSMLGSGPGKELCEVWTVVLDGGMSECSLLSLSVVKQC